MNKYIAIAASVGALAIILGAFGAHSLKPLLTEAQFATFHTASQYHIIHAVVLLVIAISVKDSKIKWQAFTCILVGVVFFSGSLYVLSTKSLYGGDAWNFLGPITPIGGLLMIIGWGRLAWLPTK